MTGDGKSLCEGEYKAEGGVSYEYISDRRKRERGMEGGSAWRKGKATVDKRWGQGSWLRVWISDRD